MVFLEFSFVYYLRTEYCEGDSIFVQRPDGVVLFASRLDSDSSLLHFPFFLASLLDDIVKPHGVALRPPGYEPEEATLCLVT